MKFLIFNVVVAGALIYLVTGGDLSRLPGGGETAHRVTNTAKVVVDHGRDIANKVIGQIGRTEDLPERDKNGKAVTALVEPDAPTRLMSPVRRPKFDPSIVPKDSQEPNSSVRNQSPSVNDDRDKAIPKIVGFAPDLLRLATQQCCNDGPRC